MSGDSHIVTVTQGSRVLSVRLTYWPKPIPMRQFDWSAVDDSAYDGPGCPIGHGADEGEAIADLLMEMALHEPEDERVRRCREPYHRSDSE